jgi:hypothetical protein
MTAPPLSQLAVKIRPLDLADSVGKAAELLGSSPVGAAPVAINGHVVGVVSSSHLAAAMERAGPAARDLPVAALQPRPSLGLPGHWTPEQALGHLRQEGLRVAPVLDASGRYVGMVSVAELATAICGRLRPPSIGGMATPFGVYLTDGVVRGGVGNWALASTGVYLGLLTILSMLLSAALVGEGGVLLRAGWPGAWLGSLPPDIAMAIGFGAIFAALFRLSWITGYHAAEHQVVHAIERCEDLRPAAVQRQPRVHPRCGTNLVVGMLLITRLWQWQMLRDLPGELGAMIATVLVLYFWRRLGGLAQQHITTRPATEEQIQSGIRAGEQLLARYQESHRQPPRRWQRIWNMGLCQVASGFGVALLLVWLLSQVVPVPGIEYLW